MVVQDCGYPVGWGSSMEAAGVKSACLLYCMPGKITVEYLSPDELSRWIPDLIRKHHLEYFYKTYAWRSLRESVLREQHYECQICRQRGLMTPAATVHHIQTVRQRPDLALTRSNLIAVCEQCHYDIHHGKQAAERKKQWNDERW